ncbi:MAG: ATP-binding cassette domain-containing protein [Symbiopectobacterium sp.]
MTIFDPLNLLLEPSLCGLVGRNGCGKTSLLRLLAGQEVHAFGHIERAGSLVYAA